MSAQLANMMSLTVNESRVEFRQQLPMNKNATIQKVLGEGRFLISDADKNFSLKYFGQQLVDIYASLKRTGRLVRMNEGNIKVGETYLYCESELEFYRVKVMEVQDLTASVRYVDFGFIEFVNVLNLYSLDDEQCDDIRTKDPFVARVNLPNDDILQQLGLPTSDMIKQGDWVEVTLLTSSEPHLAVFGLARSDTYRVLPKNLTKGFNAEETKNWLSLFDSKKCADEPSLLQHGYGKLQEREFHSNRLAIVSYVQALDKVYVHDLESSLRLALMRDRLNAIYEDKKDQEKFALKDSKEVTIGAGAVVYHEESKNYIRVEVIALGVEQFEVAPIDLPSLGNLLISVDQLFKIPKSLMFPRQCFAVRMTRSTENEFGFYFNTMARCLLPDKTAVVLDSEPKCGLTKILCAAAPKGILSKIGFVAAKHSKFDAPKTIEIEHFKKKLVVPKPQLFGRSSVSFQKFVAFSSVCKN